MEVNAFTYIRVVISWHVSMFVILFTQSDKRWVRTSQIPKVLLYSHTRIRISAFCLFTLCTGLMGFEMITVEQLRSENYRYFVAND